MGTMYAVSKPNAEAEVRRAKQEYEKIAAQAAADIVAAIQFREKSANLMSAIDTVHDAIDSTIKALDTLMPEWKSVADHAKHSQDSGPLLEAVIKKDAAAASEIPDHIFISSASCGAKNVTDHAKILFKDGEHLHVPNVAPSFLEPWADVTKSISTFHTFGKGRRIFICAKYTGTHLLKADPISESGDSTSMVNEVRPLPKPADIDLEILAIVYGKQEIRDQSVHDYCYRRPCNHQPIQWSSANFAGDNWSTVRSRALSTTRQTVGSR
ncbi:MAG: hypothetical protein L6R39_005535 [Caloplaca ligustica]|nr:MAG: hypothetical protein L6R39_005535 [Caloplaca ligustica]